MSTIYPHFYEKKNFFVLGSARSGISAARLLKKHEKEVFVSELKTILPETRLILEQENIPFEENGHTLHNIKNFDVMVVSPGISLSSEPVVYAKTNGLLIVSEIELALGFINPQTRLIGITGTNGKSTTTHYLAHLLSSNKMHAAACGNIGTPLSEVILLNNNYDALSVELSSYQLELGLSKRFSVSILLNLQNDHLERHKTYENYLRAKWNLILGTHDNGLCIIDTSVLKMAHEFNFKMPACHIQSTENHTIHVSNSCLIGAHNAVNLYAASQAAMHVGVPLHTIMNEWEKTTSGYKPLSHRLEVVHSGEKIFINDSKATNVESTLVALEALNTPIHLLLGGTPKGDSYKQLSKFFGKNVVRVYPFGDAASLICRELNDFDQFLETPSCGMISASQKALQNSRSGDTILLSPACSSFDEFMNFEHRGDVFKKWVKELFYDTGR